MVCKLTPKGVNIYIIANYCKDYTSETAEYIAKSLEVQIMPSEQVPESYSLSNSTRYYYSK